MVRSCNANYVRSKGHVGKAVGKGVGANRVGAEMHGNVEREQSQGKRGRCGGGRAHIARGRVGGRPLAD
eukprot:6171875-Pleurochrysis_carterae.AAC.2